MVTTLLQLALTLLIAAQGPNVPTDLRDQAIHTATYAIEYAEANMAEENPHKMDVSALLPLVDDTVVEVEVGEIVKSTYDFNLPEKASDKNGYGLSK